MKEPEDIDTYHTRNYVAERFEALAKSIREEPEGTLIQFEFACKYWHPEWETDEP